MGWDNWDVKLLYEVGDISIHTVKLRALTCSKHFLDLSDNDLDDGIARLLSNHEFEAVKIMSFPAKEGAGKLSFKKDVIVYSLSTYEHHYVNTKMTFLEYLEKFKSKTRSTLKRKVAKFSQCDSSRPFFRKFKTSQEIDTFITLASRVSSKTYQHHLFNRGIPDTEEFRLNAMKEAELGLVRGYLLYFDGNPVAYTYAPTLAGGVLLYDYNGYDPASSKLSPGTVIQYKIIEDLCSDSHIAIYDLCTGEDEAKRLFSTTSRHCVDVLILRKSAKSLFLVTTHLTLSYFSKCVGNVLKCINLKSHVKKYIRRNSSTVESY